MDEVPRWGEATNAVASSSNVATLLYDRRRSSVFVATGINHTNMAKENEMGIANRLSEVKDAADENDVDPLVVAMMHVNERLRTLQVTMGRIADSLEVVVQIMEDQTYAMDEPPAEGKPPVEEKKARASKKDKEKEKEGD